MDLLDDRAQKDLETPREQSLLAQGHPQLSPMVSSACLQNLAKDYAISS